MKKKKYIHPSSSISFQELSFPFMNKSLPYGGEDGPGTAEVRKRDDYDEYCENEYSEQSWGNLW